MLSPRPSTSWGGGYLNFRKVGVGTIIYVLHALSSWAGVYEQGSITMGMVGRSFQCRINGAHTSGLCLLAFLCVGRIRLKP